MSGSDEIAGEPRRSLCFVSGAPDWWTDYRHFDCEREEDHPGPHRMTIEWADPVPLDEGT